MSDLNTKKLMKAALDDLVGQGINAENVMEFMTVLSGTLGFVLGALHVATDKRVSLEDIDTQIDNLSDFIKSCARKTTEFEQPKAN